MIEPRDIDAIMADAQVPLLVNTIFGPPTRAWAEMDRRFEEAIAEWQESERRERLSWERIAADRYVNYGMLDWGESAQDYDDGDDDEWWNE